MHGMRIQFCCFHECKGICDANGVKVSLASTVQSFDPNTHLRPAPTA